MKRIVVCALLLIIAGSLMPCFAQGELNKCSPAGTWFGGSTGKYLMSIVPIDGNEYTITWQAGFKPMVPVLTLYSGRLETKQNMGYVSHAIALVNKSDLPPVGDPLPPSVNPEVWAIRAWLVFSEDCNTIESTIDFWGAYFWQSEKIPFVDPPDYYKSPVGTLIKETYHRTPTKCLQCP